MNTLRNKRTQKRFETAKYEVSIRESKKNKENPAYDYVCVTRKSDGLEIFLHTTGDVVVRNRDNKELVRFEP